MVRWCSVILPVNRLLEVHRALIVLWIVYVPSITTTFSKVDILISSQVVVFLVTLEIEVKSTTKQYICIYITSDQYQKMVIQFCKIIRRWHCSLTFPQVGPVLSQCMWTVVSVSGELTVRVKFSVCGNFGKQVRQRSSRCGGPVAQSLCLRNGTRRRLGHQELGWIAHSLSSPLLLAAWECPQERLIPRLVAVQASSQVHCRPKTPARTRDWCEGLVGLVMRKLYQSPLILHPGPLPTLTSSLEGGDTAASGRPAPQTRSLRSVASGVALVLQVPSPDNYCTGCAGGGVLEAVCVARLAQACLQPHTHPSTHVFPVHRLESDTDALMKINQIRYPMCLGVLRQMSGCNIKKQSNKYIRLHDNMKTRKIAFLLVVSMLLSTALSEGQVQELPSPSSPLLYMLRWFSAEPETQFASAHYREGIKNQDSAFAEEVRTTLSQTGSGEEGHQ